MSQESTKGAGSPHDRLFKATFRQPLEAAGLLRSVLPKAMCAAIEWSTITPLGGSFVDEELRFRHTDLLFRADLTSGKDALVYVVVEHQSSNDHLMAFRMLAYVTRVLEQHVRTAGRVTTLPPVIPVVISHAERGWTAPIEVQELFETRSELSWQGSLSHLPSLQYFLDDLHGQTEDAIRGRALSAQGRLTLLALREARVKAFAGALRRWGSLLQALEQAPEGVAKLSQLLEYCFWVGDDTPDEVRDVLDHHLSQETTEGVMTTAEQLISQGIAQGREQGIAQGREQGIAQGIAQGKAELLEKLLRLRFGDLGDDIRARLASATNAELDRWSERVVTVSSLTEVFDA